MSYLKRHGIGIWLDILAGILLIAAFVLHLIGNSTDYYGKITTGPIVATILALLLLVAVYALEPWLKKRNGCLVFIMMAVVALIITAAMLILNNVAYTTVLMFAGEEFFVTTFLNGDMAAKNIAYNSLYLTLIALGGYIGTAVLVSVRSFFRFYQEK